MQIFIQLCLPSLYDTWDDLLLTRDTELLISIFTPLVELLLSQLGTTFKNFLSTFEDLHKTAHKGSSHTSFSSKEEKFLLKQYQTQVKRGDPDPELLTEISSVALQKAKLVWLETYHDSIYHKLVMHMSELYEGDIDDYGSFAKAYPLDKPPQVYPPEFCPDTKLSKGKISKMDKSTNAQVSLRFCITCTFFHGYVWL